MTWVDRPRREALARGGSDHGMSHIAISEQLDGKSVDWLEKVSDTQYASPVRTGETR